MKVLHLTTSIRGGAGIAAQRLASAADTFSQTEIFSRETIEACPKERVPGTRNRQLISKFVSAIQTPGVISKHSLVTPLSVSFYKNISKVLKCTAWDVVHIHATYNFLRFVDIARIFEFCPKVVVTLHDERFYTGGCHYSIGCKNYYSRCKECPQIRGPLKGLVESQHIRDLASLPSFRGRNLTITAPSSWLACSASKSSLLSSFRIEVIRNCVPNIFFESPQLATSSSNSPHKLIRLGFVSNNLNNPYKGIETLLSSYKLLRGASRRNFSLKFLGNGKLRTNEALELSSSNSDLETRVFLESIDVLVVPSKEDNLPNVILEALATGKIVVGSAVGGIQEILNLFRMPTFTPGNAKELSDVLDGLHLEAYDAKNISNQARALFGIEVIANNLREIYFHRS